jgi:hypothetical protein
MISLACLRAPRLRPPTIARAARVAVLLTLGVPPLLIAQGRDVPTPASVLGFEPGADRKLPTWAQVTDYFGRLDAASPRISVRTLGKTTLGRPFLAAFIGDSATLADLPRYQEIQRKLADARLYGPRDRATLLENGKVVVLVTSSIHSTEVGGILTPLRLAHRLVTGEDAESRAIRANALVILVPSLNPDGVDIVGDWYRSTLGTPYEGSDPPELYHHYTGHDNNRDWYAFTQVETQMTIDSLHNVWHPQIVNDIHQQGSNGSRIFIPPYMDPVEPNIDPILTAGVNAMGMAMAWRLTADGKTGIATNASYDAWTPARAYQHYHGGIRILTETASADLATPINLPFDSLRPNRGYDPRVTSWNFVSLWPGGRWSIGDIVDYQTSATWALLAEASRDRAGWLASFARIGERAVQGRGAAGREQWPIAFVIPQQQPDKMALRAMLRILQRGQVEVRRATSSFATGNVRYSAGTYVVLTAQPYGSFAKALLEVQRYPDLREYPGGPPKRPYDVTAHTLPLLMGVGVGTITDSFPIPVTEPIEPVEPPVYSAEGLSGVSRRRIALYRNYAPALDEGWTRWVFDQYRIPYTRVTAGDIRAGGAALRAKFDVIVLPDQSAGALARGPVSEPYPDSLRGGLGEAGAAALRAFVSDGGTLVALNEASVYAIQALSLPVKNVLAGVAARDFYGPGSLLRVIPNRSHWMTRGLVAPPAAWFEDSPAFDITDSTRAVAVAVYPAAGDPLISGWLLGGQRLNGKAALVDVTLGSGHVILFGFRPQYRGQSMAMYPLLWGALTGP